LEKLTTNNPLSFHEKNVWKIFFLLFFRFTHKEKGTKIKKRVGILVKKPIVFGDFTKWAVGPLISWHLPLSLFLHNHPDETFLPQTRGMAQKTHPLSHFRDKALP